VSGLGRIGGKLVYMPPDGFELPTEAVDRLGVGLSREYLIYKARDDITAERKPRRRVVLLLSLEPSALEKGLMIEDVRRRPYLTE
jgi:hypothetical protein